MLKQGKLDKCYTPYVRKYLDGSCYSGYLGHEHRLEETDVLLEQALQDYPYQTIGDNSIYELVGRWLCSRPARHTMDLLPTTEAFRDFILDRSNIAGILEFTLFELMR